MSLGMPLYDLKSRDTLSSLFPSFKKMSESFRRKALSFYSSDECVELLQRLQNHDPYTLDHSLRVSTAALGLGTEAMLSESEMLDLFKAALLHDTGKIFIPKSIIQKPSRLTDQEYEIVKKHPVDSAKLALQLKDACHLHEHIRAHHERFDGGGYPDRVASRRIPLFARFIFIVDTFDAMTYTRVYRKGLAKKIALSEIDRCSGTQFDPHLVPLFLSLHGYEQESTQKKAA